MKRFFALITVFLFGIGVGYLLRPMPEAVPTDPLRLSEDYPYVSPLLLCSSPGALSAEDKGLEADLEKSFDSKEVKVSVYYRDLFSGVWAGVNEDQQYAPSSILKIPLGIAYLKLSEADPNLLDLIIEVPGGLEDYNAYTYYKAQEVAQTGQSYSVRELLRLMLIYSDNNAKVLLDAFLADRYGPNAKQEIYSDFSLSFPEGSLNEEDFMSVQEVVRFFRVLFNATYLSTDSSELLMSWLTESDFDLGLRAAIPTSVAVAEKFGENVVEEEGVIYHELHDCGVVYYPEHPYLLCVMTKGAVPFDDLSVLIQGVSQMVYDYTDNKNWQ